MVKLAARGLANGETARARAGGFLEIYGDCGVNLKNELEEAPPLGKYTGGGIIVSVIDLFWQFIWEK